MTIGKQNRMTPNTQVEERRYKVRFLVLKFQSRKKIGSEGDTWETVR